MMPKKILNVLIVGCGNIAGGFDLNYEGPLSPCTHAGAFTEDPRFTIIACLDPDEKKTRKFKDKWDIPYIFSDFESVLTSDVDVDVVSLCSPTQYHHADIKAALSLNPILIFCEKPITTSFSESFDSVNLCDQQGVLLAVNYNRRWDNNIIKLKEDINSHTYGQLHSVVGLYNKGILNNGSHLLDMLHYLLGELHIQSTLSAKNDYFDNDPSVSAMLVSDKKIPIHLVTADAKDYAIFEVQFIFSSGILTMLDGGLVWSKRKTVASERYEQYTVLDSGSQYQGGLSDTMLNAVDNIYHAVTEGAELNSTGRSALLSQRLCEDMITLSLNI